MNKFLFTKKNVKLLIQNRLLRVSFLLTGILLILALALFLVSAEYSKKIQQNEAQIQDAEMQLIQLQKIANLEEGDLIAKTEGREFAPYDQIVPFIGLLESLFAIIDSESQITVKNKESEIYINRYADYEVHLKPDGKFQLFLKALDELHKSRYLTKIISFNLNYAPGEGGGPTTIKDAQLIIRLYFE